MSLKLITLFVLTIFASSLFFPQVTVSAQTFPCQMSKKQFLLETSTYNGSITEERGVKYINLSTAYLSHPMGMTFDSERRCVWITLYPSCANPEAIFGIAKVDLASITITVFHFPYQVDSNYKGAMPWTIAVADNGELWISIRGYLVNPSHPPSEIPYLAKLNPENFTLAIFYIPRELGAGCDVKCYNSYVWYMTCYGLSKIDSGTEEIVEFYEAEFYDGFMEVDSSSLWLSSVECGFVARFNTITETFDLNLTGFERPLGLEADENYVYVAENVKASPTETENGTIALINKTNYAVTRITVSEIDNEGLFYVHKTENGDIWWTDNSQHVGAFSLISNTIVSPVVYQSKPYCYFMVEVPAGSSEIWFSCKGSAYVGIIPVNPYDVDGNGKVDEKDVTQTAKAIGAVLITEPTDPRYGEYWHIKQCHTCPHPSKCDVDRNGKIDKADLLAIIQNRDK